MTLDSEIVELEQELRHKIKTKGCYQSCALVLEKGNKYSKMYITQCNIEYQKLIFKTITTALDNAYKNLGGVECDALIEQEIKDIEK